MDMNSIGTLISTVGFPIACCIFLIYSNIKTNEMHRDEVEKLRVTIDNNTKAMLKLAAKIGVDVDE